MPQTWNRWIRREFTRAAAQPHQANSALPYASYTSDPSYATVQAYWDHYRTQPSAAGCDIDINPRDSIAYNMARVVWLAHELSEPSALVRGWRLRAERDRASDRFNFTLVPLARQAGLNVRASRSRHGDAAWNLTRMRWLEGQVGHLVSQAPQISQTAIGSATRAVNGVPFEPFIINIDDLTFGVEFECIMPHGMTDSQLATTLTEAGLPTYVESYNHRTRGHWKIVTDMSLSSPHGIGREVVSPVLQGEAGFATLQKMANTLNTTLGRHAVNRTCGFHVHVGLQGRAVQLPINIIRIYNRYEQVIDSVLAESRRHNNMCRPTLYTPRMENAQTMEQLRSFYGFDRFRKVNLEAFWRHGTIEFRQHQGTVDAEKATNWVKFCLRLVAMANSVPTLPDETNLQSLLGLVAAEESEQQYFVARQEHFASAVTGGDDD